VVPRPGYGSSASSGALLPADEVTDFTYMKLSKRITPSPPGVEWMSRACSAEQIAAVIFTVNLQTNWPELKYFNLQGDTHRS